MISRWSELSVVMVHHSDSKAMWDEAIVRSGEVGSLRGGRWVGESRLRSMRLGFVKDSIMRVPLAPPPVYMLFKFPKINPLSSVSFPK